MSSRVTVNIHAVIYGSTDISLPAIVGGNCGCAPIPPQIIIR
jgi:hypothetical protein